jgi:hypothetical protein
MLQLWPGKLEAVQRVCEEIVRQIDNYQTGDLADSMDSSRQLISLQITLQKQSVILRYVGDCGWKFIAYSSASLNEI